MTRTKLIKVALFAGLIVTAVAFFFSPWREAITIERAREMLERFSELWYGPIVFMGAYILGCVFFMPASFFIVVAGVTWGWKLGGLYSVIGGSLGAFASFELGRYALGDFAWKILAKRGPRLAAILGRAGFRTLLMLRLVPLVPFPVFNYGAGLTAVRARDFYLSTFLGLGAPTFIIAYSGDALLSGELTGPDAFRRIFIVGVLLASMIGLPTLLKRRFQGEMLDESSPVDESGTAGGD